MRLCWWEGNGVWAWKCPTHTQTHTHTYTFPTFLPKLELCVYLCVRVFGQSSRALHPPRLCGKLWGSSALPWLQQAYHPWRRHLRERESSTAPSQAEGKWEPLMGPLKARAKCTLKEGVREKPETALPVMFEANRHTSVIDMATFYSNLNGNS